MAEKTRMRVTPAITPVTMPTAARSRWLSFRTRT
jgi:hypothetical protein